MKGIWFWHQPVSGKLFLNQRYSAMAYSRKYNRHKNAHNTLIEIKLLSHKCKLNFVGETKNIIPLRLPKNEIA